MLAGRQPNISSEPSFEPRDQRPVRWALVLSSGTVRGLAHIGVLKALEREGLRPDLIVGTSAGALVGVLAASGLTADQMRELAWDIHKDLFVDWTVPRLGMVSGRSIHDFVDAHVKVHRIEEFPVMFAAVSVEAEHGCLHAFNRGDPGLAVQASSTVPVLITPVQIGGRRYLDGALASPLPVRLARALGAERVVAVDVTYDPKDSGFSNIVGAFWRTSLVMRWALTVSEAVEADVLIAPRLPHESEVRVSNREALIDAGERAAAQALPAIRTLLQAQPTPARDTPHPALLATLCADTAARLKKEALP